MALPVPRLLDLLHLDLLKGTPTPEARDALERRLSWPDSGAQTAAEVTSIDHLRASWGETEEAQAGMASLMSMGGG